MKPQLASTMKKWQTTDTFINDDDYIAEQKLDGKRLLVTFDNGVVIGVWNREGKPAALPSELASSFFGAQGQHATIDGELVGDTLYVFDVVMPDTTLWERLALLDGFMSAKVQGNIVTIPRWETKDEKRQLLEMTYAHKMEGVVFKNIHSYYQDGHRNPLIVKHKWTQTADVVVKGPDPEGKQSVRMSLWHNGQEIDAGGCKVPDYAVGSVNTGDVIEVKYLYATDSHKLFQPSFVCIRTDKSPEECTTEQLKYTSKEVLS